jgi:hypothetical protein
MNQALLSHFASSTLAKRVSSSAARSSYAATDSDTPGDGLYA